MYKRSTAELLYSADVVYLSRKHDDLTIEADLVSNQPVDSGQSKGKTSATEETKNEAS